MPPEKHRQRARISPTRAEDFPGWFQSVVRTAHLAELAHVRGCMVLPPWGYATWELMQSALDGAIKATGHENAYFPLFIPLSYFEKEAEHVEGFAKEMAVVTHHRLEAAAGNGGALTPAAELAEPLIVRPTSETIIGRSFASWIQSYRDLPLLINQWANVVRWEMRPRVLLRTTEFLWQEGHTAHATSTEAQEEAERMLGVYREFAEGVLAVPVISGDKPDHERFPGAVRSLCIEAMMQDGKALQAGTSHYMGQNFAEASGIEFTTAEGTRDFAYTTSWGTSTRLLGAVVMTHGDDNGLRLPPMIAPQQVVIVPIVRGDDSAPVEAAHALARELRETEYAGQPVRVRADDRERQSAEKRWEWIGKGVPLVVEIGPRDLERGEVTVTRRDRDELSKETVPRQALVETIGTELADIQTSCFETARQRLESRTAHHIHTLDEFREWFSGDESSSAGGGFVRAPWSGDADTLPILEDLKVSIRCLPYDAGDEPLGPCVVSGRPGQVEAIFAKAY